MGSIVTVLTPAVTQDLTTLETAKVELGVTDPAEDNKILTQIRQASDAIAYYCNRVFGLETVEETFIDVTYRKALRLTRRPVVQILSLTQSESLVDPSEYFLDERRGIIHRR